MLATTKEVDLCIVYKMSNNSNPTIIVPARLASIRFPRKLLADAGGKPLIIRTAERISSEVPEYDLYFAVDGNELKNLLEKNGYNVILTPSNLPSGTDRIATANKILKKEKVINIQADEPLVTRGHILSLSKAIFREGISMATLASEFEAENDFMDPNQVKVVTDNNGLALYFSRAPIPHYREKHSTWRSEKNVTGPFKHMGLYAYDRVFLDYFLGSQESELEKIEKLEQLRALQNGFKIAVEIVKESSIGIDMPNDLEKIRFE